MDYYIIYSLCYYYKRRIINKVFKYLFFILNYELIKFYIFLFEILNAFLDLAYFWNVFLSDS